MDPTIKFSPLINRKEVCKILGISLRTFCRLMDEGRLPVTKISTRKWAVTEKALQNYIEQNTHKVTMTNLTSYKKKRVAKN